VASFGGIRGGALCPVAVPDPAGRHLGAGVGVGGLGPDARRLWRRRGAQPAFPQRVTRREALGG
jgi:hypothetical protein